MAILDDISGFEFKDVNGRYHGSENVLYAE